MNISKPTESDLNAIESTKIEKDGITAYQVTKIVNEWLKSDGKPLTTSQRVYTQFMKKVPSNMKLGSRLTEEGAQFLANLVYKNLK